MRPPAFFLSVLAPLAMAAAGCGRTVEFHVPDNVTWQQFAFSRDNSGDLRTLRIRPEVCDGYDLRADYGTLNEASFIRFLEQQRYGVQVQRQQVDTKDRELDYVFVTVPGIPQPVPLRVAVLPSADDAGRSLLEGVLERGSGSWGVHRANVAVLGPIGSNGDDVAFAAATKLACWGTVTIATGSDDAFVVPGGYAEP
jgi:hypothetical protein